MVAPEGQDSKQLKFAGLEKFPRLGLLRLVGGDPARGGENQNSAESFVIAWNVRFRAFIFP